MQFLQFELCDFTTGAAIPFGKCTVYLTGTATLAALFDSGGSSISNPAVASSNAVVGFAAADGTYDFQFANADGSLNGPKIVKQQMRDLANIGANETIYLKSRGVVDDGVTVNSAAAINAILNAGNGRVVFPNGLVLTDGPLDWSTSLKLGGYGPQTAKIRAPAGMTVLRCRHNGGFGSSIEDLELYQAGILATSTTGTYVASSPNQVALSGVDDFVVNHVIEIPGAGDFGTLKDRAFACTSGSNVVTWAYTDSFFRGNSIGPVNTVISLLHFPAGTRILSWGSGTATLSANATATDSGLTASIYQPIVTEITSITGVSPNRVLHFTDLPPVQHDSASVPILHAAPGIYADTSISTNNIQVNDAIGVVQVGMVLAGITTGGSNADNGAFTNSHYGGGNARFGVFLQGTDAQVETFLSCNFAGPEGGFVDASFISSYLFGPHFAFGLAIWTRTGTRVSLGYLESGTAYIAYVAADEYGQAAMYDTESFLPGSGFGGHGLFGTDRYHSHIYVRGGVFADSTGTATPSGLFTGGFAQGGPGPIFLSGSLNFPVGLGGTTINGAGILAGNSTGAGGGVNGILSMLSQAGGTYQPLGLAASAFRFGSVFPGSQFGTWDTSGLLTNVPLGYTPGNGIGGAITQITSRTTGVTINKLCGAITLFSAPGSATWQTVTVTNSQVAANDNIRFNQQSGTDKYMTHITHIAAGAFDFSYATTGGTTTEQPVFNFLVEKGANS